MLEESGHGGRMRRGNREESRRDSDPRNGRLLPRSLCREL